MRLMQLRPLLAAVLLAPAAIRAQVADPTPTPTPEEVRKVVDYYQTGKDRGPILVELKPCLTIDTQKDSPTRWECAEPVTAPVKKGTVVSAWTSWLVPQDGKYEDVVVQWVLDGQVRSTQDVALSSSWRSRTYKSNALSKKGKWSIKILRGAKEVGSADVQVE
jgi:hypothetical protein